MTRINQHVLIIDNATTCSMRLKVLIQIHGVMASIVHWSDWEEDAPRFLDKPNCLVVIEQSVPKFVVQSVASKLPNLPFFLLFNGKDSQPKWHIEKQVNPLSSSLSNFELISLLEPFWAEEKAIHLPATLILDESPEVSFNISQTLADANIPCQISNDINVSTIADVDLVMVNVGDYIERTQQLEKIVSVLPNVGIIAYGTRAQLTDLEFVQFALRHKITEIITFEQLQNNWLNKFYRAWRASAEQADTALVNEHIQSSLDHLLEKNLVLKVLFETALDGVVCFDIDGQMSRMNTGFTELIGSSVEKLIGANLFKRLSHQSRVELSQILQRKQLIQQQVVDLQLVHEHNVLIAVSASINKINFQDQSVFVAVMRNNTNQQLNAKLLLQKNVQLEHQAKRAEQKNRQLIEKSRSVERNKNAFMVDFSKYLALNLPQQPSDMQRKVHNIETYFSIEAGQESNKATSFLLSDVLKAQLEELSALLNSSNIAVKLSVMDFQKIRFGKQHLERVLSEVLTNAIKYSPQGGVIQIKQFINSSKHIELEISDTGEGILDHQQSLLFDLYEANLPGTLDIHTGLPLAKKLLQLHNSDIRIENNVADGRVIGTSFILTLPLD
ncbi:MAG: PAS domain S-box protein [Gammaproteobacteria bacterium]|nr:PAS domain S-box protein [Gammaproteobacteria bacterium]